jgi:hypothetical protein
MGTAYIGYGAQRPMHEEGYMPTTISSERIDDFVEVRFLMTRIFSSCCLCAPLTMQP